jgi:hypothetical protein
LFQLTWFSSPVQWPAVPDADGSIIRIEPPEFDTHAWNVPSESGIEAYAIPAPASARTAPAATTVRRRTLRFLSTLFSSLVRGRRPDGPLPPQ